jgi:hypothetical protein
MTQDRLPLHSQYAVVTLNKPVVWPMGSETWLLNPKRRHVFSAAHLQSLTPFIETVSDLKGSTYYQPLMAGKSLASASVLVDRHRDRGIGDLLFLTGVFEFMQHISGNNVKIDMYAMADRGAVLQHHPALHLGTTLAGPLLYDDLGLYNYQWLIDSVTECSEEPDQLNVYDAMYQSLGFNHADIDPKFKRPSARLVDEDFRNLDQLFAHIYAHKKVDFRRVGYYVVAPFAAATLRSMNYSTWLAIIKEMATRRPVVVVGNSNHKLPEMDMSAGEFQQHISTMPNVINAIGATPLRVLMALISKATCSVALDSGTLYIAQAVNTPAISIWGSHDPGVRIGYDKDYMDLAIWNQRDCRMSPCFAYAQFPAHKCPNGAAQDCCDVLATVMPEQVLQKLDMVESRNVVLNKFTAAT